MNILKSKWTIVSVILVAVVLFAAFGLNRKDKTQYFTARVERGDLRAVVEATGTINAVTSVQVGSQVSGNIYKLHADFNSKVKRGQLIGEIEPSLFQGALLQAKADYENAKANVAAAKANLEKAKASRDQTKADYERTVGLTKAAVMSQQQLDLAKANYDSAVAGVSAADAQVTQAVAQVEQRKAAVSVAQTNLDHTYIYAPIDGTVVNRAIDVGQTVAASLQAPTLFTIAQDLTKMQVYTATDESDVGQIRVGQKVSFKVDAFPRETFRGVVSQIRMNPTTVQNVVTYNTIIDFENPELKLFPGMTAYVTIPVANAHDVLKVPNGALRYSPDLKPDELRAVLKQNGIEPGGGRRHQPQTDAEKQAGQAPAEQATAAGAPGHQPGAGANGGHRAGHGRRTSGRRHEVARGRTIRSRHRVDRAAGQHAEAGPGTHRNYRSHRDRGRAGGTRRTEGRRRADRRRRQERFACGRRSRHGASGRPLVLGLARDLHGLSFRGV